MFKHWFTPQVIATFKSKYNSDIQVIKFGNSLRLDMGHLTQSGSIISSIWSQAFKKLLPSNFTPQNCLVLGLGGGSVITLIAKKWPLCQIIAVEIDPIVIKIARQYFHINQIKNLKIINIDAVKFVSRLSLKNFWNSKYNLTLIDCYQGDQIPTEFEDISLLQKIKQYSDYLLLNRLYWADHKIKTKHFINQLETDFSLKTSQTPSNLVLSLK